MVNGKIGYHAEKRPQGHQHATAYQLASPLRRNIKQPGKHRLFLIHPHTPLRFELVLPNFQRVYLLSGAIASAAKQEP